MDSNLRTLLARTLQAEAGNQGYDGMMDVGSVIRNREASGRYGEGIEGVIMKPGQFSAWNGVTGYAGGQQGQNMDFEPNEEAYRAADAIIQGTYEDRTGGATHYYNPDVGSGVPKWGGPHFKRIGAHVFGNADAGAVQGNTGPMSIGQGALGATENVSQNVSAPHTVALDGSQGGSRVSTRNGTPEASEVEKPWYENFLGLKKSDDGGGVSRLMGWDDMDAKSRDDQWLAIGAGLLSGNDWASGIGAAGQNVLGLRQLEEKRAHEIEMGKRGASRGSKPMGMALMNDGTQRADIYWDARTSSYRDAQGNDVGSQISEWLNKSDSYGSKGQMTLVQANKTAQDLIRQGNALKTFDRVITALDDVNYGAEGFLNEMQIYYKTLLQTGLTEEEISRKAAQGELQGLVGATREQVVGGGVMTEQDALRVIQALGGDMQSLFSNPEVGIRLLRTQREKMLPAYQHGVEQYDYMREAYPNIPYRPLTDKYQAPSQSTGTGGGVDDILKGYGI